MNDYKLKTSEVIERLKIGEVAEGRYEVGHSVIEHSITKNNDGEIVMVRPSYEEERYVELDHTFLNMKWKISPQYISFGEAMIEVEKGNDVKCHFGGEEISFLSYKNRISAICYEKHCTSGGGVAIKIAWITVGKWFVAK